MTSEQVTSRRLNSLILLLVTCSLFLLTDHLNSQAQSKRVESALRSDIASLERKLEEVSGSNKKLLETVSILQTAYSREVVKKNEARDLANQFRDSAAVCLADRVRGL